MKPAWYGEDEVREAMGRPASWDPRLGGRPDNGDAAFNARNRARESAERRRRLPAWMCDILDLFAS